MNKSKVEELDLFLDKYYATINDSFNFTQKYGRIRAILTILFGMSIFIFFLGLLPFFPFFASEKTFVLFREFVSNCNCLESVEYSFWIGWVFTIAMGAIPLIIIFPFVTILNSKKSKFIDSLSLTRFCYSYELLKNINIYLINQSDENLETCKKYFQKVIEPLLLVNINFSQTLYERIDLKALKSSLQTKSAIIGLSDDSIQVIDNLYKFKDYMEYKLEFKDNLKDVVSTLQSLVRYEFSRVKPDYEVSENVYLGDMRGYLFDQFIKEIEKLSFDPFRLISTENDKISRLRMYRDFVRNCFLGNSIFNLLISWFILFIIIFIPISLLIIYLLDTVIDSTLLIGLLTTPIVAAVSMTGIIYKSKSN